MIPVVFIVGMFSLAMFCHEKQAIADSPQAEQADVILESSEDAELDEAENAYIPDGDFVAPENKRPVKAKPKKVKKAKRAPAGGKA